MIDEEQAAQPEAPEALAPQPAPRVAGGPRPVLRPDDRRAGAARARHERRRALVASLAPSWQQGAPPAPLTPIQSRDVEAVLDLDDLIEAARTRAASAEPLDRKGGLRPAPRALLRLEEQRRALLDRLAGRRR